MRGRQVAVVVRQVGEQRVDDLRTQGTGLAFDRRPVPLRRSGARPCRAEAARRSGHAPDAPLGMKPDTFSPEDLVQDERLAKDRPVLLPQVDGVDGLDEHRKRGGRLGRGLPGVA